MRSASRLIITAWCSLMALPPINDCAHAQTVSDVKLVIDADSAALNGSPVVTRLDVSANCCEVSRDANGRWVAALTRKPDTVVTSYKIAAPATSVVAVRLDLPTYFEEVTQRLVLRVADVPDASDRVILNYYSSHLPAQDNLDDVWGYLQDLHFIVGEQRKADADTNNVSAARVRAAFMLLQSVVRLGEETWYIVHPDYQANIDFADTILARSVQTGVHCRRLGRGPCGDVAELRTRLQRLQGARLAKIWLHIEPPGTRLDRQFCTRESIRQMDLFYDYFVSEIDSLSAAAVRTGSGLSEARIAMSLGSCIVSLASCSDSPPDDSIELLRNAERRLINARQRHPGPDSGQSIDGRLDDVREKLDAMETGRPIVCSGRQT